jgi:hypothetical protein
MFYSQTNAPQSSNVGGGLARQSQATAGVQKEPTYK